MLWSKRDFSGYEDDSVKEEEVRIANNFLFKIFANDSLVKACSQSFNWLAFNLYAFLKLMSLNCPSLLTVVHQ